MRYPFGRAANRYHILNCKFEQRTTSQFRTGILYDAAGGRRHLAGAIEEPSQGGSDVFDCISLGVCLPEANGRNR